MCRSWCKLLFDPTPGFNAQHHRVRPRERRQGGLTQAEPVTAFHRTAVAPWKARFLVNMPEALCGLAVMKNGLIDAKNAGNRMHRNALVDACAAASRHPPLPCVCSEQRTAVAAAGEFKPIYFLHLSDQDRQMVRAGWIFWQRLFVRLLARQRIAWRAG